MRIHLRILLVLLVATSLPAQTSRGKGDGDKSQPPMQRSIFDKIPVPADAPDENPRDPLKAASGTEGEIPIQKAGVQPNSFSYYFLTGQALRPRDSNMTFVYTSNGCFYQSGGAGIRFNAPLLLNEGDTIKFLRVYYNDTSAADDLTAWITKYEPGESNTDITSASSTGAPGFSTSLSSEVTEVVDDVSGAYTINFGTGISTSANQLCGVRIAYYPNPPGGLHPIPPCRVFDTRFVGPQTTGAPLPSPGPHNFRIQDNCGVPDGATAIAFNATVLGPTQLGDLRLYPTGAPPPLVSTLNYPPNPPAPIANGGVVRLGTVADPADKDLTVAIGMVAAGTVHLIFDVTGYYY